MILLDPRALRRFRSNRGALAGVVVVIAVGLVSLLAPVLSPHPPDRPYKSRTLSSQGVPIGPCRDFPLGADTVGRDELSRLLHGGRVSLAVAFAATGIVVLLGTAVGVLAGYLGGWVDTVLMRTVDALLSLPFLLVVMALNRVLERPGLWVVFVVLGGLSWPAMSRQVRAKTQQLRELDYVLAARALGAGTARIVFRHLLPNLASLVVVIATTLVAEMIVAESVLSYLGVGVTPPAASWGSMILEGEPLARTVPRLVALPGAAVLLTVVGFNLLGEGLRDAFDPRG